MADLMMNSKDQESKMSTLEVNELRTKVAKLILQANLRKLFNTNIKDKVLINNQIRRIEVP